MKAIIPRIGLNAATINATIKQRTVLAALSSPHKASTMTIARKPPSFLNSEFMGILLAAKKQTEGALTTLANKNILSTHALLRILVETHIVLIWALNAPANEEKTKSDEVYKRFEPGAGYFGAACLFWANPF